MSTNSVSRMASITQEQFISLLLAGLKNQDPLEPMDSQSFLSQLSQFANLQGMQNLNTSFGEMLKLQNLSEGANLLGKTITYTADNVEKSGRVGSLAVEHGKVVLEVNGAKVLLDQVQSVRP